MHAVRAQSVARVKSEAIVLHKSWTAELYCLASVCLNWLNKWPSCKKSSDQPTNYISRCSFNDTGTIADLDTAEMTRQGNKSETGAHITLILWCALVGPLHLPGPVVAWLDTGDWALTGLFSWFRAVPAAALSGCVAGCWCWLNTPDPGLLDVARSRTIRRHAAAHTTLVIHEHLTAIHDLAFTDHCVHLQIIFTYLRTNPQPAAKKTRRLICPRQQQKGTGQKITFDGWYIYHYDMGSDRGQ